MKLIYQNRLCAILLLFPFFSLAQPSISTQHNDLARTGWNAAETHLNTKNVAAGSFGKLFTRTVDDQLYAQPLVVMKVNIPGTGVRNVVYLATVNNSVYAFDADSASVSNPYWQINLTPSGSRPPKNTDMSGACGGNYHDFSGNIGIVGTPVIDTSNGTMYLVARSLNTTSHVYAQYLHSIDITTGAERSGSPQLITAQVNGTGGGSSGGKINFDPQKNNQRPGLMLLNGIVYIGFSSHCDWQPYHGWLLGYDASTLQQKIVYNVTPDGDEAGLWMSGSAPSADELGNIYVATGNGTVGKSGNASDVTNRGESALKLTVSGSTLNVASFFTPTNYNQLEAGDLDFGATAMMLIPNTNLVMAGCKDGNIFLMNRNNLGGYNGTANQNVQTINIGGNAHLRSSFAYYGGTAHHYAYQWSENSFLKAFEVNDVAGNFNLANTITGQQGPTGNNGAFMAVSSNGSVDSTAILWAVHASGCDANQSVCPGVLRAFDANDVTHELWNSGTDPNDNPGSYAKFVCPTVTNGKVYLATFSNQLVVYGLTGVQADTCNSPNVALNKTAVASSLESNAYPASNVTDADETTRWSSAFSDPQNIYVDLGQSYDLCRVVLHWENAYGKDFKIQVSDDLQQWSDIASITGNSSLSNSIRVQGHGRYVRMYGTQRGTPYGYSMYEFQVYGTPTATCTAPASPNATNITTNSALLQWTDNGAGQFAVEYKTVDAACWSVVGSSTTSVTINNLACGTDYLFRVASICAGDTGVYSGNISFSTSACLTACGPLPTRWTTNDIGCVGLVGTACYDNTVFTLNGSGNNLGGTDDQARTAYTTLVGDADITTQVLSITNGNAQTKAGLMMRQDLSAPARSASIALTPDYNIIFETRNTTGGSTVSSTAGPVTLPYWLRLRRNGSMFTGFYSPDGTVWQTIGTTTDLGLANTTPMNAGLFVSSGNNNVLSSATFTNYTESTVPLPVALLNFSGSLTSAKHVLLQWTTTQEVNTKRFIIQRSLGTGNYTAIGQVAATNEGSVKHDYSWEDSSVQNGLYFYRLQIEDLDGKITYSSAVSVSVTDEGSPLIYPNPITDHFTVSQGTEPILSVRLFDISGKQLMQFTNNASTTITFPASGLARGIYIVETKTKNGVYRYKLVK